MDNEFFEEFFNLFIRGGIMKKLFIVSVLLFIIIDTVLYEVSPAFGLLLLAGIMLYVACGLWYYFDMDDED